MSTSILRSVAAAALTGSFVFTAAAQTLPSQATVLAEAGKVADYWIAHDPWLPGVASHNWTGSTLMNGYLALFEMDGNQKYFNYASTWATHYSYTLNGSDTDTFCDHYACGETFFILYKLTGSNDSTKIRHIKADIDYQTGLGS
ncbi:MAG TPA: glycoside hydrolase family 88 protein, partial [Opitutaceae bacterium]|nr:glycoside hydrolase family 88 protein [Opitutaceae bacterium]